MQYTKLTDFVRFMRWSWAYR